MTKHFGGFGLNLSRELGVDLPGHRKKGGEIEIFSPFSLEKLWDLAHFFPGQRKKKTGKCSNASLELDSTVGCLQSKHLETFFPIHLI